MCGSDPSLVGRGVDVCRSMLRRCSAWSGLAPAPPGPGGTIAAAMRWKSGVEKQWKAVERTVDRRRQCRHREPVGCLRHYDSAATRERREQDELNIQARWTEERDLTRRRSAYIHTLIRRRDDCYRGNRDLHLQGTHVMVGHTHTSYGSAETRPHTGLLY